MGIGLREGRAFTPQDAQGDGGVVIVNEAFEKHYFPGESAIGRHLRMNSPAEGPWLTVVGVAGNVRQRGLESGVTLEAYHPDMEKAGGAMSFVIRTAGAPAGLASAARAAVAEVDRNQPVHNVMSMEQRLANTMIPRRPRPGRRSGPGARAAGFAVRGRADGPGHVRVCDPAARRGRPAGVLRPRPPGGADRSDGSPATGMTCRPRRPWLGVPIPGDGDPSVVGSLPDSPGHPMTPASRGNRVCLNIVTTALTGG